MGTPIPQGARWLGLPVLATLVAGAGCTGAGGGAGGAGGPSGAGVDTGAPGAPEPVDAVNTADQPGAPPRPDAGGSDGGGGIGGQASGGRGVDAGAVSDGGAPGAGGAPAGPCKFLFCESFEDTAAGSPPDPAIWTRTSNDIVVDATRAAHGGGKSLHIPPLTAGAKYIRENKTIASMGSAFYQRVFFWIEQQPVEKPASLYHWTLLSADERDDFNAGKVIRLGGHIETSGTNWVRFNFQTHGMPGETGLSDPKLVLATKRWYCAELYVSLPNNEARVWLDGVEDPALHWTGQTNGYTFPPAVTWMTFGWAEYQAAATPWEIWIDEIAIDSKRIGCD